MKKVLNFIESIYAYALTVEKDNGIDIGHISPVTIHKNCIDVEYLPVINSDLNSLEIKGLADEFVEKVLKEHIFIANSKLDFLNKIKDISCLSEEEFNDLIKDESKVDKYLIDLEGYLNYKEGESLYIRYDSCTNDTQSVSSINLITDVLKWELDDAYFHSINNGKFKTQEEQLSFNKTLVEENRPLINEIYNSLMTFIKY